MWERQSTKYELWCEVNLNKCKAQTCEYIAKVESWKSIHYIRKVRSI